MKRFVYLILFILVFSSCSQYREIKIDTVHLSSFRLYSTSRAELAFKISIDNPTKSAICLCDIAGVLSKEGRPFANIQLKETIEAPPMSISDHTIIVCFNLLDPMALLSIGLNISSWDMNNFTLNGYIQIKTETGLKKKVRFRDVTLERVLKILD